MSEEDLERYEEGDAPRAVKVLEQTRSAAALPYQREYFDSLAAIGRSAPEIESVCGAPESVPRLPRTTAVSPLWKNTRTV